jgi:predicted nucleotidyltransferase component of viral defense system
LINQAEIRRIAGSLGVDPQVIDHDYVLGCFLHYLSLVEQVKIFWIFKGGTSLAKCHFSDYRFSEDLDFTALNIIGVDSLLKIANSAKKMMQDSIGIRTDGQETKVEVIQDDYGKESFEVKIYYEGPWIYGGSNRSLQIHVNRDEFILFPTQMKSITHKYSDAAGLPPSVLQVYALEEILVEKLRALSGQRRFAIARDVYDIQFLSKTQVNVENVLKGFPRKCEIKGMKIHDIDIERIKQRKPEYETNWKNNLEYLIPENIKVPFEDAWLTSNTLLEKAIKS